MGSARLWRLFFTLAAAVMTWGLAAPAQAQLAPGCSCPAGFIPNGAGTCTSRPAGIFVNGLPPITIAPICPRNPYAITDVGHILAAQQQQSFWGIDQVIQERRDQIQRPSANATSSRISGYTSSGMDDNAGVTGYSAQSQKNNPLASRLYDQATTAAAPNPVWGAWVQGLADWEHDNALSPADIAHFTTTYTAQAGLDRTQLGVLSSDDAFVVGIVASWENTRTGYFAMPTTLRMSGPGVGVYTEYVKGGFSTDVTAKFDFL